MKVLFGILLACVLGFAAMGQSADRPAQPNLPGDIGIDFGLNFMYEHPEVLNHKIWPSRSFGIYYERTFKLSDKFTFVPRLGVGNERFGWKNDLNFIREDTSLQFSFDTLTLPGLKKNMLTMTYVELPLELRFHPFGTKAGEGFFVGAGVMFGYRFDAHTKIKYKVDDVRLLEKDKAHFGLNDFRYGVQGRIGWRPINLHFKYYLSSLFSEGPLGSDPRMFTAGLTFSGF